MYFFFPQIKHYLQYITVVQNTPVWLNMTTNVCVLTMCKSCLALTLLNQLLWWSLAASMARCSSGSLSPGGAASELACATTSEVGKHPTQSRMLAVLCRARHLIAAYLFLVLGIDSEGHAANFVETEQIVQYNNCRASFVQVSKSQHESAFISHLKNNISEVLAVEWFRSCYSKQLMTNTRPNVSSRGQTRIKRVFSNRF